MVVGSNPTFSFCNFRLRRIPRSSTKRVQMKSAMKYTLTIPGWAIDNFSFNLLH